ncbi:hypothetical protein [Tenacibaculum sp. nBUS_03]|uniref:hypothetical protein n=1 Tax=Tenacibaculum sp. nBUS_03 TaxID=3395320 RepID=UPI003EB7CD23
MLLTREEAVAKYGKASLVYRFTLQGSYGEFRNNITNQYIHRERVSKTIMIDEVTWEKIKKHGLQFGMRFKKASQSPKQYMHGKKELNFKEILDKLILENKLYKK